MLTRLERREFPALVLVGGYDPASVVQFACLDFVLVDPLLDGPIGHPKFVGKFRNEPLVLSKAGWSGADFLTGHAESVTRHQRADRLFSEQGHGWRSQAVRVQLLSNFRDADASAQQVPDTLSQLRPSA